MNLFKISSVPQTSHLPILVRALMVLLWARFPVWEYVFSVMKRVPFFASSPEIGLAFLIITLAFLSLPYLANKLSVMDVIVYLLIVMFYKFQYVLFPQNTRALQLNEVTFLYCVLPYMFYGRVLKIRTVLNDFRLVSMLSIFLMFFSFFVRGGLQTTFEEQRLSEYMSGAYFILPHLLLLTWMAFDYRDKLDIGFSILGIITMLAMGNRGSMLLYLTFIGYMLLFMGETKSWIKKYRYLIIVLGLTSYTYIAKLLTVLLVPYVPTLRVLESLANNQFFYSEGRELLRENAMRAIYDSPLEIRGVTSEWLVCGGFSHNIIIDFFLSFGVFFGTILLVALCALFIIAYKDSRYREEKIYLVILILLGIGALQISGTYLASTYLFFSIGYAVSLIITGRNYRTKVHHQQLRQSINPHGEAEA